jgi:CRP-like cAMP-binding protein
MLEILRKQIETIVKITDDEFNLIKNYFSEKHCDKKEYVFIQNEYVDSCYFVISGLMKLVYVNDLGKEFIFSIVNENRWESDFMAYFYSKQNYYVVTMRRKNPLTVPYFRELS